MVDACCSRYSEGMEIYIGADHNGFELKNELKRWLADKGYAVQDMGPSESVLNDDYPDAALAVAKQVAEKPDARGILICGSGVGVAVAANKVKGVRAALIHDADIARVAKKDDDINVLALGAQYVTPNQAKEIIEAWLMSRFSKEERHVRRIKKIAAFEDQAPLR